MQFSSNNWLKTTDSASLEPDRDGTGKPWGPLADGDDDGGDRTTEVDPEI